MHHLQTFKDNRFTFTMRHVEGGTFDMGAKDDDKDAFGGETLLHSVTITAFKIGEYPVTQALWSIIMNHTNITAPSRFEGDNHPVEQVSWEDITNIFLPKLNEITENLRPKSSFYRLPTESEWEFAAKGGNNWANMPFKYAGSNKLNEVGWFNANNHKETKPVGLKTPNFLGLYDMNGNVCEWCEDQWHDDYDGAPNDGNAWLGENEGTYRIVRGGSWYASSQSCRSTNRSYGAPSGCYYHVGFRLVLAYPSVE
jgi:formylglycine-generating enzyme